jgi:hypothetical protein
MELSRQKHPSAAEDGAEKGLRRAKSWYRQLQGLKPDVDFIDITGPAEALPLLQSS